MLTKPGTRRRQPSPWVFALTLAVVLTAMYSLGDTPSLQAQSEPGDSTPTTGDSGNTATDTGSATSGTATAGTVTSGTGAVVSDEHPDSYLDFAMAGGYLMIPIGLFSILWLAFFVERLTATRKSLVVPSAFVNAVRNLPPSRSDDQASRDQVQSLCTNHPSSAARVLTTAVNRSGHPREEIESAVNTSAQREIHSLRKFMQLFAVIAAVAPLIGLLGTVTGMIQAFREVAIQGLGSGQALAPGIYKALVTTAAGLMVAIPALITYHWFMSRVDNYVHEIDMLVTEYVDDHSSAPVASEGVETS